jgi:hypothetical protein
VRVTRSKFTMTRPDLEPWERQPDESKGEYHAFCHYRDFQPSRHRSLDRAYREHCEKCLGKVQPLTRRRPMTWGSSSARWGWVDRVALWDADVDRQARRKLAQVEIEARERHARIAQATLTVLSLPVKAALEAAQDRRLIAGLVNQIAFPSGFHALLTTIVRVASVLPAVVTMERQALGMTDGNLEIKPERELDFSFADRIVRDQAATELAIRLLDRVAR